MYFHPYTAINSTGGGEEWEEVDLSNFPTDWVDGDRIKISFEMFINTPSVASWTGTMSSNPSLSPKVSGYARQGPIIELIIRDNSLIHDWGNNVYEEIVNSKYSIVKFRIHSSSRINSGSFGELTVFCFNGASMTLSGKAFNTSEAPDYIYKMWRLKK